MEADLRSNPYHGDIMGYLDRINAKIDQLGRHLPDVPPLARLAAIEESLGYLETYLIDLARRLKTADTAELRQH